MLTSNEQYANTGVERSDLQPASRGTTDTDPAELGMGKGQRQQKWWGKHPNPTNII